MSDATGKRIPTLLTIAGSDTIGGAGIQADIKTATALRVYAMSVITALTAQNTFGVVGVSPVDPSFLSQQLDAVLSDVVPDVIKIGMVPSMEAAAVIADALSTLADPTIIVDPIGISTSGSPLAGNRREQAELLFPKTTLVTPNFPEAEFLLGRNIADNDEEAGEAAKLISRLYNARNVLIKGGHRNCKEKLSDVLYLSETDSLLFYRHPGINTNNTHGTGCTLSSAIASYLAHGVTLEKSVEAGIDFLQQALESGRYFLLGGGKGSPDIMFGITPAINHVTL